MRISELLIRQKENVGLAIKKGEESITYQALHLTALEISESISTVLANDSLCVTILLPNSILENEIDILIVRLLCYDTIDR